MEPLWAFNTAAWNPTDDHWRALLAGLPSCEREAVVRFVREVDQRRALVSRYLARRYVTECCGVPPTEVDIRRTPTHKKPYIGNALPPELAAANFNVSHHGSWVVLAASTTALVGVDVTRIELPGSKPVHEFLAAFETEFTSGEWAAIQASPSPLEAFYWWWAVKEAYAKARGDGLVMGLARVEFRGVTAAIADHSAPIRVALDGVEVPECRLAASTLDDDHPVVVATLPVSHAVEPLGVHFPTDLVPPEDPLAPTLRFDVLTPEDLFPAMV